MMMCGGVASSSIQLQLLLAFPEDFKFLLTLFDVKTILRVLAIIVTVTKLFGE